MPYQETGGYCRQCQSRVLVRRPGPNHVLHLLLTLLSAGLWLIVWIGVSVRFGGWICSACGSKATTTIPANAPSIGSTGTQNAPRIQQNQASGFILSLGKGLAFIVVVVAMIGFVVASTRNSLRAERQSSPRIAEASALAQPPAKPASATTRPSTKKQVKRQTAPLPAGEQEKKQEGKRVSVPSDPTAKYYIIEHGGTPERPIITTKRIGKSGTSYCRREYDCQARTFRYLGDGDTVEEMNASKPSDKMGPLVDESISDYIGRAICR